MALTVFFAMNGAVSAAKPAPPSAQSDQTACLAGATALNKGKLDEAKHSFLDVLAINPASSCASVGLGAIVHREQVAGHLCAEASQLSKAGKDAEATRRYVAALRQDSDSKCAREGLAPADDEGRWDSFWRHVGDAIEALPRLAVLLLGALAFFFLALTVWRRRGPSLVVENFADGAIDSKIGSTVSALVQQQLVDVGQRERRTAGGYELDVVVADVELLAKDQSLAQAVGAVAAVPQMALAAAILGFIDSAMAGARLSAGGELVPAGKQGFGLALAFYRDNGVTARTTFWSGPKPATNSTPAVPAGEEDEHTKVPFDPSVYYEMAPRGAAWIQYEAAISLDAQVEVLTRSADSFAALALGIRQQRAGNYQNAVARYVDALRKEADNAAALYNLAGLLAGSPDDYLISISLLYRARQVLEQRYRELA